MSDEFKIDISKAKRLELYDELSYGRASIFDDDYKNFRLDKDFITAAACGGDEEATEEFFNSIEYQHLSSDRDFMRIVIASNPTAFQSASSDLREDKEFLRDVLSEAMSHQAEQICEHLSYKLKQDKQFALEVVQIYGGLIEHFDEEIRADKAIAIKAVSDSGSALQHISRDLRNDKDLVLEAVRRDRYSIHHASDEIQELCKDKDPIKVLESVIAHEKLHSALAQKAPAPKQVRGLKL